MLLFELSSSTAQYLTSNTNLSLSLSPHTFRLLETFYECKRMINVSAFVCAKKTENISKVFSFIVKDFSTLVFIHRNKFGCLLLTTLEYIYFLLKWSDLSTFSKGINSFYLSTQQNLCIVIQVFTDNLLYYILQ